jgi:hypothetical protein
MMTENSKEAKPMPKQFENVAKIVRYVGATKEGSEITPATMFALLVRLSFGNPTSCLCDHGYHLAKNAVVKAGLGQESDLKAIAKIKGGDDRGHYLRIHSDEALIAPALVFKETNQAEAALAIAFACRWGMSRMSIFEMQEVWHVLTYTEAFDKFKHSIFNQVDCLWSWLQEQCDATQSSEGEAVYQFLLRQRAGAAISLSAQVIDLGLENRGRFETNR